MCVGTKPEVRPFELEVTLGGTWDDEAHPLVTDATNDVLKEVIWGVLRQYDAVPLTQTILDAAYWEIQDGIDSGTWPWKDKIQFSCGVEILMRR